MRPYSYYYISLEHLEEAKILKIKKIDHKGLVLNSPVPVEYEIKRESYILFLTISETSSYPNFNIQIVGEGKFKLVPRRNREIRGKMGEICGYYELYPKNPSRLFFAWSSNCRSDSYDKIITFDVFDENDVLIKSENIPFILKRGGHYWLLDAI